MTRKCLQGYESVDPAADEDVGYAIAEVERIWKAPLGDDLILTGGVDGYGWFKACRLEGPAPDIYVGEYRSSGTWYQGRFRLQWPDGSPPPDDAIDTYYVDYYSPGRGLVLHLINSVPPPVPYLFLVPLDEAGFKPMPRY